MNNSKAFKRIADFLGVSINSLLAYRNRPKLDTIRNKRPVRPGHGGARNMTLAVANKTGNVKYRLMTLRAPEDARSEDELSRVWRNAEGLEKTKSEELLFHAVHRHATAVIYNSLKEKNPDLAHDIAVAAIGTASKFRGESKFSTWVQGIAKNKIKEELRTRTRRRRVFDEEADYEEELNKKLFNDARDDLEQRSLWEDLTSGLSPNENALLDAMKEGRNTAEIAEMFGIKPDVAESRGRRLIIKLKKQISNGARRLEKVSGN